MKIELVSASFITFKVTSGVEQITRQVPNFNATFPYLHGIKEEIIVTKYLNK
jgi:hypothetical protein